jgi:hypothetical protein
VANEGGVRGEGAVGLLLTMARETGGPVRHGGAWRDMRVGPACQRGRKGES